MSEGQNISEMLQFIRRQHGLSQEELARRLDVSYPTVNACECGRSQPYPRHLKAISDMYASATKAAAREQVRQRVLVVEDDPSSAMVLRDFCLLALPGWEVEVANSGYDAILRIGLLRPALVLLDLMMPEIDGFKVYERLRALPELSETQVIVVTAATDDAILDRARALHPLALIQKPLRRDDIVPVLQRAAQATRQPVG